jgi:hypothetical protein
MKRKKEKGARSTLRFHKPVPLHFSLFFLSFPLVNLLLLLLHLLLVLNDLVAQKLVHVEVLGGAAVHAACQNHNHYDDNELNVKGKNEIKRKQEGEVGRDWGNE